MSGFDTLNPNDSPDEAGGPRGGADLLLPAALARRVSRAGEERLGHRSAPRYATRGDAEGAGEDD